MVNTNTDSMYGRSMNSTTQATESYIDALNRTSVTFVSFNTSPITYAYEAINLYGELQEFDTHEAADAWRRESLAHLTA